MDLLNRLKSQDKRRGKGLEGGWQCLYNTDSFFFSFPLYEKVRASFPPPNVNKYGRVLGLDR